MSLVNNKIATLLIRYLEGELEGEKLAELENWRRESTLNERIAQEFMVEANLRRNTAAVLSKEAIWQKVTGSIQQTRVVRMNPAGKLIRRTIAAASVILLAGVGIYLAYQNPEPGPLSEVKPDRPAQEDIPPGQQGAVLTLADGTQVVLDSLGNGVIALQNGAEAVLQNGRLVYDVTGASTREVVYNTMTTPKGRQFHLQLPDGTRVWLNAASSIRYPTVFSGGERRVDIQGEAYFEVMANAPMPFRVNIAGKAEVEVMGTHFNINAYENETGIYATLLEGSIAIRRSDGNDRPGNRVLLKPGSQAQLDLEDNKRADIGVVHNADIEHVMAWKNGLFDFNNQSLQEVMRQLERWYDIDVVYESVPTVKLKGKMTRDVPLSGLLKNLGKLGVRCKLEGRKLFVLP